MEDEEFIRIMDSGEECTGDSETFFKMHELSQRAMRITAMMNGGYHAPEEIRRIMSDLVGYEVDEGFTLFPPFHTNCGKGIRLGKNVFINTGCHFQDQGGIWIGDDCLIGQCVIIATLNHNLEPEKRANMTPRPVRLGKRVWVGSGTTILPGVTIGDNCVIGAGSVVTKDVPENSIAVGNPARVIRAV